MISFVLRRLLIALPTLLGAFALIFLLTRFVPGDPVQLLIEENVTTGESYDSIQRQLGLDKPVWGQFFDSLANTVRGDFGTSFQNRRPVGKNISEQLPATIQLTVAAMIVSAVIGIPAGIIAAVKRNRWPDFFAMVTSLVALCAPSFWLGIILILIFSLKLEILPTFGVGNTDNPLELIKHLVLPAFTLGAAGAGIVARITRSSMLEVLSQDYIRTGRAKGLSDRVVILRHALRNAMIPVTTVFGLEAVALLSGTVIVETVFARRGIGRLLIESILTRDYPQIQGVLLFFVGMAILVNLLVDILYGVIDPRIRYD